MGKATILRQDGSSPRIAGKFNVRLRKGERIRIETPGGGGWGHTLTPNRPIFRNLFGKRNSFPNAHHKIGWSPLRSEDHWARCHAVYGLAVLPFFLLIGLMGYMIPNQNGQNPLAGSRRHRSWLCFCTVFYGVLGFIFGALGAFLYNLIARWLGGIEMQVQPSGDQSSSDEASPISCFANTIDIYLDGPLSRI